MEQVVVQRFGARRDVRHGVVLPVGLLLHTIHRSPRTLVKIVRHLAIQIQQPLEVDFIVRLLPHDHLSFRLRGGIGVLAIGGFLGGWQLLLSQFQDRILVHFLLDSLLERHDRQLQNLHRLDHPRRHLLDLHLSRFESE